MDSSRTVVCSGEEPCLEGMAARGASFSTWKGLLVCCRAYSLFRQAHGRAQSTDSTYSDLEINKLLGECAHLVVEAEAVLADLVGSEDEVALSFLRSVKDDLLLAAIGTWAHDRVIDVERTARLNGEVERDLGALVLYVGEEAGLLVCIEAVGEGGCVHGGAVGQQEADNRGKVPHRGRGHRTASFGVVVAVVGLG